ncbi:hypothetical protein C7H19_20095 [Aphanothece hegewaldii CCALA 016]|uniref:DNA polymerase I n=1 Tax=Aphanothece hegewaldii CCALA 016 TaxID=2107694 RepID=A0A2T1LT29_9CHRO|nr:DNA polymerase [Aphanothece hegewaldii]PSF33473.1 hypothetical protein C7H19_20095 [Aphanothece hegewaldii CCALA 016]
MQLSILLFNDAPPLNQNIVLLEHPQFTDYLSQWQQASQFGLDIETYSTKSNDASDPTKGEIRTLQIGLTNDVLLVDLGYTQTERSQRHQQLAKIGFWDILKERLANPCVEVIGQALSFEQKWLLAKYQFCVRCIRDIKLASQVYWAGLDPWLPQLKNQPHSLASIGLRMGIDIDKTQQTSDWGWGELGNGQLSNRQLNYAAQDAQVVLELYTRFQTVLKAVDLWDSFIAECLASPAFAEMEYYGMPVNYSHLVQVKQCYQNAYDDLLAQLQKKLPQAIAYLYSPHKLTALLNATFALKLTSASSETLSPHWNIAELRLISVIKTTKTYLDYLENLQINHQHGVVCPRFKQINRKGFGRSSASEPNTQNPPNPTALPVELQSYNLPTLRSVFQAPQGFSLIVADLSKAHSRIAAQVSRDPELLRRFNSEQQDIFLSIVVRIAQIQRFGKEWTEENIATWLKNKSRPNFAVAKRLRAVAKAVHYGSLNLQGWRTLQQTILSQGNIHLSDEEAKSALNSWQKTYRVLAKYQRSLIQKASKAVIPVLGIDEIYAKTRFGLGYVRSLTGRGVFLAKYPKQHQGVLVQGTEATAAAWSMAEADMVKRAMGELLLIFDMNSQWQAQIVNCCHDEIIVQCLTESALAVAKTVQSTIHRCLSEFIVDLPVDEPVNPQSLICQSWDEK